MSTATVTMTPEQAAALRKGHDKNAVLLSRKPKHELLAIYESELAARHGWHEGVLSKDELVSAILALRDFTIPRLNEATHVIGHADVVWPDCPWCAGSGS